MMPTSSQWRKDSGNDGGEGGRIKKVVDRADGSVIANWIGYHNTLLRYYLHLDPDTLSDEQWAETIAQLVDIRKQEAKANKL